MLFKIVQMVPPCLFHVFDFFSEMTGCVTVKLHQNEVLGKSIKIFQIIPKVLKMASPWDFEYRLLLILHILLWDWMGNFLHLLPWNSWQGIINIWQICSVWDCGSNYYFYHISYFTVSIVKTCSKNYLSFTQVSIRPLASSLYKSL